MLKGNRSIERRIVNSLLGYTLFIIALLWIFQIMHKASIMQAGNQILISFTESDFETKLIHICFSHGMSCVVIDSKGKDRYSIDMLGRGSLIHSPAKVTVGKMIEPIVHGDKEEIVVQVKNKRFRNDELIYAHSRFLP